MAENFKANEIDLINSSTDIYDAFDPIIKEKVKQPSTQTKVLNIFRDFMTKNESKLSTNIIGKQILLNDKMEKDIYDVFGLEKEKIREVINNSLFFKKTFGRELQLIDQLCLAVPLIFASLEYKRKNNKDLSDLCYLMAHFKPYASRESLFFKYGVNEGQMFYTIEKSLSERFDIKKYGTIIATLRKKASSSYENYIAPMKMTDKMTDKRFYVLYTSGIASSVNAFIGSIVEIYRKNEGKSLDFENAIQAGIDADADETEFSDADIESDTAAKAKVVNKAMFAITKTAVNRKLTTIAAQVGFASSSTQYIQMLERILTSVVDKMFNSLPTFFNAFISSFLNIEKDKGVKYQISDITNQVFIKNGIDILVGKKSNIKDTNLLMCRNLFKQMLMEHSADYLKFKDTYKRKLETSLAAYWVFLIKTSN